MSSPAFQALSDLIAQDPGLRKRLETAADAQAAAEVLSAEATRLALAFEADGVSQAVAAMISPMSDDALGSVSGGNMPTRNLRSPYETD